MGFLMARHLTDRTVWITANKMLYVANLHRDGLLKVGVTDRPRRRRTELRHTLSAPKLSYIIEIDVPWVGVTKLNGEADFTQRFEKTAPDCNYSRRRNSRKRWSMHRHKMHIESWARCFWRRQLIQAAEPTASQSTKWIGDSEISCDTLILKPNSRPGFGRT